LFHIIVRQSLENTSFESISVPVHAFDWHEREIEDVFELNFIGHPRLGDFVLHDEQWIEGLAPMRKQFNSVAALEEQNERDWKPRRILVAPGAFVMPVGPIFSGISSPVNYLIETVGEEVIRSYPRLFYNYKGIEKVFEDKSIDEGLLLSERFAQNTAISHGVTYCNAIEKIFGLSIPDRALILRGFLAELERIRHHTGVITEIIESTALGIAASEASIAEEELLRLTAKLTGHRYGINMICPGGMRRDISDQLVKQASNEINGITESLMDLQIALSHSSSFLDRLEEVGTLNKSDINTYGLVGPIARASGTSSDLRKGLPYGIYSEYGIQEQILFEGDNYARLRVLFNEIAESNSLCTKFANAISKYSTIRIPLPQVAIQECALGWVEAPQGANFFFVRINPDNKIVRTRIMPPAFANWHGLHKATEGFAFQDFPICLSTLGLSVGENDR
jgi:formate hydrogenlyase subunit 5